LNELGQIEDNKYRQVAEIRRADPYAPRWHFIPPEGNCLCFDPNGAICWRGRYHLFYIFQDPARRTGSEFRQAGHCWGHASSADLLHWTYHPTALAAEPGDPESAIYSGCAFVTAEGVPAIAYHGCGAGTCLAFAEDDGLIRWRKSPHNPVIREPKPGEPGCGVYNVFDPHVWREGDAYYAILGGQVKPDDIRDTAYLFRSTDLVYWEYLHPFYAPNPAWTGENEDCACPDFFPLGDRHALVCISHAQGARCYVGAWREEVFYPDRHIRMNWPGGACHAPETMCDGNGRRLFWAWTIDQRRSTPVGALGVMTLPRVLSLGDDGGLRITPAEELEALRNAHQRFTEIAVPAGTEIPLPGVEVDSLELALEVEVKGIFGVKLRVSSDGGEQTAVTFDAAVGTLSIDTRRSSLAENLWRPYPIWDPHGTPSADVPVQQAPFTLAPNERLRLRLFLDRSILEIFANDRLCLTQRLYPTRADSLGVRLFAGSIPVLVHSIDVWKMGDPNGIK